MGDNDEFGVYNKPRMSLGYSPQMPGWDDINPAQNFLLDDTFL